MPRVEGGSLVVDPGRVGPMGAQGPEMAGIDVDDQRRLEIGGIDLGRIESRHDHQIGVEEAGEGEVISWRPTVPAWKGLSQRNTPFAPKVLATARPL